MWFLSFGIHCTLCSRRRRALCSGINRTLCLRLRRALCLAFVAPCVWPSSRPVFGLRAPCVRSSHPASSITLEDSNTYTVISVRIYWRKASGDSITCPTKNGSRLRPIGVDDFSTSRLGSVAATHPHRIKGVPGSLPDASYSLTLLPLGLVAAPGPSSFTLPPPLLVPTSESHRSTTPDIQPEVLISSLPLLPTLTAALAIRPLSLCDRLPRGSRRCRPATCSSHRSPALASPAIGQIVTASAPSAPSTFAAAHVARYTI